MITKKDLIELLCSKEEQRIIDTAIPLDWANKVREYGIDTKYVVWLCDGPIGRPIFLADRLLKMYIDLKHIQNINQNSDEDFIKKYPLTLGNSYMPGDS